MPCPWGPAACSSTCLATAVQILADVFEAVCAAVYLDSGHNMAAVWFVLRNLYAPLFASVRRSIVT